MLARQSGSRNKLQQIIIYNAKARGHPRGHPQSMHALAEELKQAVTELEEAGGPPPDLPAIDPSTPAGCRALIAAVREATRARTVPPAPLVRQGLLGQVLPPWPVPPAGHGPAGMAALPGPMPPAVPHRPASQPAAPASQPAAPAEPASSWIPRLLSWRSMPMVHAEPPAAPPAHSEPPRGLRPMPAPVARPMPDHEALREEIRERNEEVARLRVVARTSAAGRDAALRANTAAHAAELAELRLAREFHDPLEVPELVHHRHHEHMAEVPEAGEFHDALEPEPDEEPEPEPEPPAYEEPEPELVRTRHAAEHVAAEPDDDMREDLRLIEEEILRMQAVLEGGPEGAQVSSEPETIYYGDHQATLPDPYRLFDSRAKANEATALYSHLYHMLRAIDPTSVRPTQRALLLESLNAYGASLMEVHGLLAGRAPGGRELNRIARAKLEEAAERVSETIARLR